jgi:hypothetical protein
VDPKKEHTSNSTITRTQADRMRLGVHNKMWGVNATDAETVAHPTRPDDAPSPFESRVSARE